QPLVWLDLEMTGLDLENDTIIEAACLMSDGNLETTIEGPEIAIQQSEAVLASMNPWCIDHHGASGLTQRCRESTVSIEQAEEQLLEFVGRHTEPGEARLAGNSVHVDMQFLRRRMPRLFAHFHHRIIDVSTVAELAARWFPADYRSAPRKKQGSHTALADVRESLEELRFYRKTIFKQPPSQNRRRR
ncbi:ribonuclease H-like protein, partial [Coccomyxa subellipsoidea C-169]